MTKASTGLLLAGTLMAGALAGPQTASAQSIELKMANWVPPVHHFTRTAADWVKTVEAASGGKISISLDKNPLAKPPGQYDLAKNGVRDLIWHVAGYTPGRFVAFRFAEVPFASPDAETGSVGHYNWYVKHGLDKKEMDDVQLITSFVHGPGMLHSKREVTRLEDLKGMKIRVGGGGVLMAERLGAVPVVQAAPASHESLQRGTTEAALFPFEAVRGFSLAKLVKYHLEVPGGLYTTPFMIVMNKAKFEGLPTDARNALMKAGGAAGAKLIGAGWDAADDEGRADAKKEGNTINVLSEEEQLRWAKAIQIITDDWIKKGEEAGYDSRALMADLMEMMKGAGS